MSTFLLSFLFLFAAPAKQTTNSNAADLCTIQGVVVKAGTDDPLPRPTVEVWSAADNLSRRSGTMTDALGRFELKGLEPGQYFLSAEHNGFVTQKYGQYSPWASGAVLTLSLDQTTPTITMKLIPAAVIAGHVYDESGEPVVNATVETMYHIHVYGKRLLKRDRMVRTNDLGEYRIFGLYPGQYIVTVMHRTNPSEYPRAERPDVRTYYPGVLDASRAKPITVRAGEEFATADVRLPPVSMVRVTGSISGAGCGASARRGAVLLNGQNSGTSFLTENFNASPNAPSAFEFRNVVPDTYFLHAELDGEGKRCIARRILEVASADVEGLDLVPTAGIEIKGRLLVEGQTYLKLRSTWISLSLQTADVFYGDTPVESVKRDGSFVLKNVFNGDYEINVGSLPENYFVKSARLDDIDVLNPGLIINTKKAPGLLEILVSPKGASIDGVILKGQQPFPGATVALVPDPPHRAIWRLFKSVTTDMNGHFLLQGVPPDEYKLFAWERIEFAAYTSPESLQPYENLGRSVHITEGSHNSVQVDLIPANEKTP